MPPYQPPQQPQQPHYPPQAPYGPPSQSPQDPYHFILNPEQPKRPSPLGKPAGLLFILAAVVVVVILLVVILNIARGGGESTKPFITIAQEQQEIGRVAGLDISQLPEGSVKNFALTTQMTMSTDSGTLTTYLGKHGVKISAKEIALGKNSSTDTQLTTAISSNTLDSTLKGVLQTELKQYQTDLAKAYRSTTSSSGRTILKQLNTNAELLLTQSQQ